MAKEWFVLHILHVPKCALLKIPEVKCTTYRRFETFDTENYIPMAKSIDHMFSIWVLCFLSKKSKSLAEMQ